MSLFLLFVPAAILTNTFLPIPFEPVLLFFIALQENTPLLFAVTGAFCAGAGAFIDVKAASLFSQKVLAAGTPVSKKQMHVFCVITAVCAFLPIPFATIRVGLWRVQPKPLLYAIAVASGRFPRYLMIVYCAASFGSHWLIACIWLSLTAAIGLLWKRHLPRAGTLDAVK